MSFSNLHKYFKLHVCLSLQTRPSCPIQSHITISAVGSQNVTNKSSLVCVKSEKYAFWVILSSLGSMWQGEAEIHALQYQARQSRAAYIKTHLSVSSPPHCRSKAVVCASTPRRYPLSRYFIEVYKYLLSLAYHIQS